MSERSGIIVGVLILLVAGGVGWYLLNGTTAPHDASPVAEGHLTGSMTIGPICPVERPDHPCLPTPEQYAAHVVYVYASDHTMLIAQLAPDANGKFSATLPAGGYWVDVAHQPIGAVTGAPKLVSVPAGGSVNIAIDIDTGIR